MGVQASSRHLNFIIGKISLTNMMVNLPYTALRAFEAVVRLKGFGRAAEELSVTQSAVSQHVKSLETWTGQRLLVRGPRETQATPQGRLLAEAIADGLGRIEQVTSQLRRRNPRRQTLIVSCPPGFAVNWLFPRLLTFDQAHPDVPVSLATHYEDLDLAAGVVDAAIRYGTGGFSGLHAERLLGERIFPVCAPSLLRDGPPLATIADLGRHTLLVDELSDTAGNPPTWEYWAEEHGLVLPKATRSRRFGQSNLAIQAAKQGLGVALGREPLVIDALVAGELVRPFPQTAFSEFSYWLICQKRHMNAPPLRNFRDWLQSEARAQPELPAR